MKVESDLMAELVTASEPGLFVVQNVTGSSPGRPDDFINTLYSVSDCSLIFPIGSSHRPMETGRKSKKNLQPLFKINTGPYVVWS